MAEPLQLGEIEDLTDRCFCQLLLLLESHPIQCNLVDSLVPVNHLSFLVDFSFSHLVFGGDYVHCAYFTFFALLLGDCGWLMLLFADRVGHCRGRIHHAWSMSNDVGVLVSVWILLCFLFTLLSLRHLFLLSLSCGFFSLFFGKFSSLDHPFFLLCFLKFSLFFLLLLLFLEFLLSGCRRLCSEFGQFFLFFSKLHLSFLFFNHGVHFGRLHA